jgi:phage-related protein
MARLTIVPDWSANLDEEPRVLRAKFGDGYEQRTSDGVNPLQQRWSLGFDNRPKAVIDDLIAFFRAHRGADAFDFPLAGESWAVTDSGFGVGTGARTQFQLQRPGLAKRTDAAWQGEFPIYTKPRTNLYASDDLAAWSSITPTANVGTGPGGEHTADKIAGTGVASTAIISPTITSDGGAYCFSMWAKNVPGQPASNFSWGLRNTTASTWYIGPLNIVLTNDWVRYYIATAVTTAANSFRVYIYPGGTGANTLEVMIAKTQLERGVTSPTRPIAGPANTIVTPAYYPDTSEGFVPATGWTSRPQVYKDGVLQNDLLSVYTLEESGLITFAAAPASNSILSFTGSGEVVKRAVARTWKMMPVGPNNYSLQVTVEEVL